LFPPPPFLKETFERNFPPSQLTLIRSIYLHHGISVFCLHLRILKQARTPYVKVTCLAVRNAGCGDCGECGSREDVACSHEEVPVGIIPLPAAMVPVPVRPAQCAGRAVRKPLLLLSLGTLTLLQVRTARVSWRRQYRWAPRVNENHFTRGGRGISPSLRR